MFQYLYLNLDQYYINIGPVDFFYKDDNLYNEIAIGDSIFKNPNSLIISVKRNNNIRNFKVSPLNKYWINPYYVSNIKNLGDHININNTKSLDVNHNKLLCNILIYLQNKYIKFAFLFYGLSK